MQEALRLVHRSNELSFAVDTTEQQTTSQCPPLFLAYSERSINAATLFLAYSEHSINAASEKVTAEHENTEAVCLGGPGVPGKCGKARPWWSLWLFASCLRVHHEQRCPAGIAAHQSSWPHGSTPAALASSGTWLGPSQS